MNILKKSFICLVLLTLIYTAGCRKETNAGPGTAEKESAGASAEASQGIETAEKINFFKSGKWISSNGIYYFIDETNGFLEHRDKPDTNTKFTYELNEDNSAVFHMLLSETDKNASVNFKKPGIIDIIWENGDTETLNFDTEEIPDSIKNQ